MNRCVFKDWGHCGACANGTVAFYAGVPLWSYSKPDPLYGDFTTETWRQFYLRKHTEPDTRYLYSGDVIAFKDEDELQQFITDYEGTLFPGNRENSFVLWCFRREYVFLPQEEWEKIDAPIVERRLNFHPEQVKIAKDMEKHITTFYRIIMKDPILTFNTQSLCKQQQRHRQPATPTCCQVS